VSRNEELLAAVSRDAQVGDLGVGGEGGLFIALGDVSVGVLKNTNTYIVQRQ
jgi:hypothetical protein